MIQLSAIHKTYRMGDIDVQALRGVSLTIEHGEFIAIMGPSGSGKSTLMHILGLLDVPEAGSYQLLGQEVARLTEDELAALRSRVIGFVFQQFNLLARTTAMENVALPLLYRNFAKRNFSTTERPEKAIDKDGRTSGLPEGEIGVYSSAARRLVKMLRLRAGHFYSANGAGDDAARALLREVGLGDRLTHRPNQLSGGQQQRVAIARALINHPQLILADEPTGNLDSTSAEEIMMLLRQLSARGMTVILVTHETDIAQQARRIIRMRDGLIQSDEHIRADRPTAVPVPAEKPVEPVPARIIPRPAGSAEGRRAIPRSAAQGGMAPAAGHPAGRGMTLRELRAHVRQAVRALTANRVRTILSMLGILIGVAAVVAMLALGSGARQSVEAQLASMGSNLLVVRPGSRQVRGVALEAGSVTRLTLEDARDIRLLPSVVRVAPSVSGRGQISAGNKNWNTQVLGTTPEYAISRASVPVLGRFFTEEEGRARARVVVLGQTVARELFDDAGPVGESLMINRVPFQVIGVLPEKGATAWRDQDDVIIVPLSTAMRRLLGKDFVDSIDVEVSDAAQLERAQEAINDVIIKQHHLPALRQDTFEIRNMAELQAALSETSRTMS